MDEDRTNEDDEDSSISRASLFGAPVCVSFRVKSFEADSRIKQRSKCGHDFIPVNQTDGSWDSAAVFLRDGRMTGHRTHSLKRRPEHDR